MKNKLRSVNTHFWSDTFILDLDPIEKLLFLYLITNQETNMLGIYELHIRRISFDTGIDKDMVLKIFERFQKANKAMYLDGYVILQNFIRHQSYNGNMKKSAVTSWNDLPESIVNHTFTKPIAKALKGFTKGSKPIGKIERESERESEDEIEKSDGLKRLQNLSFTDIVKTEFSEAPIEAPMKTIYGHFFEKKRPGFEWNQLELKAVDEIIRKVVRYIKATSPKTYERLQSDKIGWKYFQITTLKEIYSNIPEFYDHLTPAGMVEKWNKILPKRERA